MAEGGSLDATRITVDDGTGEATGLLAGKELPAYFEGSEEPEFVLIEEKKGIERERDGEADVAKPGRGYRSVAAITDERVLLVVGGCRGHAEADKDVSIPYTEIRSIETNTGVLKTRLTITTRTSDRFHFRLGGRSDLSAVEEFVQRAIGHWVTFDRRLSEAKDRVSAIEGHLEAGNPDAAGEAFEDARRALAEAVETADAFRDCDHAMHRRVDQARTRLELTEIHGHELRAEQFVADAERAHESGDRETALESYRRAIDQYERAIDLAEEIESHESEELRAARDETAAAAEAVRTEPLEAAIDACEEARETDTVEAWERALDRCHDAVAFTLRNDGEAGDPDPLRLGVEWAAANLQRAHRERAAEAEATGDDHRGIDPKRARAEFQRARHHREAAREVAAEFRSGTPDVDEVAQERLREKLAEIDRAAVLE